MSKFQEVSLKEFKVNPFGVKTQWMLITAEKEGRVNTMTASWGGFGVIWETPVTFIAIRPQRYTLEFVDAAESFSLTFFDREYKKKLAYLGDASGRDEDKIAKAGLTIAYEDGIPYFTEANAAIFAKKLYRQRLAPEFFFDQKLNDRFYPENDHHFFFFGEVEKILKAAEGESYVL